MDAFVDDVGPHSSTAPAHGTPSVRISDPAMMSRLLYSNPVCLLTIGTSEERPRNVMVVSWLSPIDNSGAIFMSINAKRFTAELLPANGLFVLNVPVAGMENLIRAIGKCSGRDVDKFASLGIDTCSPGWRVCASAAFPCGAYIAVSECVAHIVCTVVSMQLTGSVEEGASPSLKRKRHDEHYLIRAQIDSAFVHRNYWDGKCFAAVSDEYPPTLTFLGSGAFGYMRRS